jgi:Zn-dependent protease
MTRNFRKIVRDDNLTTLAGPASNLLIVLAAFCVLGVMMFVIPDGHNVVVSSFVESIQPRDGDATPQPIVMLCSLAILINLSLCIFNLLPIPPLDGSHIVRNMLPYNAVQVYDRIGGWISYLLMIFVGGFIMRLLLWPAVGVVYFFLSIIRG